MKTFNIIYSALVAGLIFGSPLMTSDLAAAQPKSATAPGVGGIPDINALKNYVKDQVCGTVEENLKNVPDRNTPPSCKKATCANFDLQCLANCKNGLVKSPAESAKKAGEAIASKVREVVGRDIPVIGNVNLCGSVCTGWASKVACKVGAVKDACGALCCHFSDKSVTDCTGSCNGFDSCSVGKSKKK